MERSMGMECSDGLMAQTMKVNSSITTSKESAPIVGQTVVNLLETGETIKCMGKVFSSGVTEEDMKDSMQMTRRKDQEPLNGLMAGNTLVDGPTASSTVEVSISLLKGREKKESGEMESVYIGLTRTISSNRIKIQIDNIFRIFLIIIYQNIKLIMIKISSKRQSTRLLQSLVTREVHFLSAARKVHQRQVRRSQSLIVC